MTDGSAVILLLRMAVSLAVVLGLIVWAARVLNRRQGGLAGRPQRHVPVTVLARQPLSRHAGLSVVQVGSDILVLGVTDAEVSLLTRVDPAALPDPAPQDAVRAAAAEPGVQPDPTAPDGAVPPAAPSFAAALRQAAGLAVRRDVKRQAVGARAIAHRVGGGPDGGGGRHRG